MTDFPALTLETPAEHPFAQFVRILGKGKRGARDLTREEARKPWAWSLTTRSRTPSSVHS